MRIRRQVIEDKKRKGTDKKERDGRMRIRRWVSKDKKMQGTDEED